METQDFSFSSTDTDGSGSSRTIERPSVACVASLKTLTPQISCLAVHRDILYAASLNEIHAFDLTSHTLIDTFNCKDPTSGAVKSIAFGREKIFTAHQDRKIRVWQATPSKRHCFLATLPTVKDRLSRCILPKNYIQVRRHKKQLWVEHADTVSGLVVNEGFLYSVSWDKSLKMWHASDLRCLESVKAHEDAVNAIAISSAGSVYTASADGKIKVWERSAERKHALKTTLEKHKSTVNALALNDDGSVLFSGGSDSQIMVWEKENNGSDDCLAVTRSLLGHAGPVLCLIYVDGLLFSGSSDRTVRIWRCGSTECLAVLEGHKRPVKSLVPISGGLRRDTVSVCSGSLDGEIRIWEIRESSVNNSSGSCLNDREIENIIR
ncbi:hypothetical protein NMG60_11004548 [Bertholletia excelsa]